MNLTEQLRKIATQREATPKKFLHTIADDIDKIRTELHYNLKEVMRLDKKQREYYELKLANLNVPEEYVFSSLDFLAKQTMIKEIAILIEKI